MCVWCVCVSIYLYLSLSLSLSLFLPPPPSIRPNKFIEIIETSIVLVCPDSLVFDHIMSPFAEDMQKYSITIT